MSHNIPKKGELIAGKYRIVSKIGEGGYGIVLRAFHETMGRDVAIKMLRQESADQPDEIERFRREVFNASCLRHPNTITLYDYGQTSTGLFYIVMEYLQGVNLHHWLKRQGPMDHDIAIDIVTQVLRSLREAHAHGIIHQDLKPENIHITRLSVDENLVKVLDFGLSKALIGGTRHRADPQRGMIHRSDDGLVCGTPYYMSPEHATGQEITCASDIYSVGLLAWEMLTAKIAFEGGTPVDVLLRQVNDPTPPLPSTLQNSVLSSFIDATTLKEPGKRPKDGRSALKLLTSLKEARVSLQEGVTLAQVKTSASLETPTQESSSLGDSTSHDSFLNASWFQSKDPKLIDLKDLEVRLAQLPMIGRTSKLHMLLHWGESAIVRGGVLWITGALGTGKSRLVGSWLRHMEMHSTFILRAQLHSDKAPRQGLRQALEPLLDEEHGLFAHYTAQNLVHAQDLETLRTLLKSDQHAKIPVLRYAERGKDWVFTSIERVFYAAAMIRPLILVLENVQWADSFMQRLLIHWQEDLTKRAVPLILVLTEQSHVQNFKYVPDLLHNMATRQAFTKNFTKYSSPTHHLHLGNLDVESSHAILDDILPLMPQLKERIIQTARGNPLYMIQIVRHLFEKERMTYHSDRKYWEILDTDLAQDTSTLLAPDLEALLMQRVDLYIQQHRLNSVLRAILRRAMVLGHRVELRLLKDFLRTEQRQDLISYFDDAIEALIDAHILLSTIIEGKPGLEFGYEMLRDNLLKNPSWCGDDLHKLHAIAAQTKTVFFTQRGESALEHSTHEIAHHHMESGDYALGFVWLMRASLVAQHMQDFRNALEYLQDASALLDKNLDPNGERMLDIRLNEGRLHRALGAFDLAQVALHEAIDETVRVGDVVGEAMASESLAEILVLTNRHKEALDMYRHIEGIYDTSHDHSGKQRCTLGRAEILRFRGHYVDAQPMFERTWEVAQHTNAQHTQLRSIFGLGQCMYGRGKLNEALQYFRHALKRAEVLDDIILKTEAELNIASTLMLTDHVEHALSIAKQALAIKTHVGDTLGMAHGHLVSAHGLKYTLRIDDAMSHCVRARELYAQSCQHHGVARSILIQASILWTKGHHQQAINAIDESLHMHKNIDDAHGQVLCLGQHVLCLSELGMPQEAIPYAQEALELINRHGIELERPKILTFMGIAKEECGDKDEALVHFARAMAMARTSNNVEATALAAISAAKVHLVLGDELSLQQEVPLALELASKLGHAYLLMCALILQVVTAKLYRDAKTLAGSLRRLRVFHEHTRCINMHIPERLAQLATAAYKKQEPERAFAMALAIIELLRSLDADALADELAHKLLKFPEML